MAIIVTNLEFIAQSLQRAEYWEKNGNLKTAQDIRDALQTWVKRNAPRGSGIDSGTTLDLDKSHSERVVLSTAFHHMDENGYYDGWTYHTVAAKASLMYKVLITVGGKNRNDIKNYLYQVYEHWFGKQLELGLVEEMV